MTNYELIRNMSVDDMAVMLTTIIHEREAKIQRLLAETGLGISLVELYPDIQVAIHKEWLESEVADNDR